MNLSNNSKLKFIRIVKEYAPSLHRIHIFSTIWRINVWTTCYSIIVITSVKYITSDLRLAPSSPTQFIGFRHNPSKLLSSKVLDQITSDLFGRPIDIALISDALKQINQAYKDAGFKFSQALLPEQTVNNGLIEIRLFEDADLSHHF